MSDFAETVTVPVWLVLVRDFEAQQVTSEPWSAHFTEAEALESLASLRQMLDSSGEQGRVVQASVTFEN